MGFKRLVSGWLGMYDPPLPWRLRVTKKLDFLPLSPYYGSRIITWSWMRARSPPDKTALGTPGQEVLSVFARATTHLPNMETIRWPCLRQRDPDTIRTIDSRPHSHLYQGDCGKIGKTDGRT